MREIIVSASALQCLYGLQEFVRLFQCPSGVIQSHRVTSVVCNQAQVLHLVQGSAMLHRYQTGFDQVQAECRDQTAVCACHL